MPTSYFPEPASWYAMVASNLAHDEIAPYAHLFQDFDHLTIFDCGANRGCWSRGALETFPNSAPHVHIFEPSAKNYAFVSDRKHGALFTPEQFQSVTINKVAVGDAAGELDLYADWDGSWLGSLVKRPDIPLTQSEKVPVVTLDDYAAEHQIKRIDILKLDVEGWEFHALKGAQRLLSDDVIRLVIFEFSQINVYTRTFFYDFWTLLTPLGFEFFFIDGPSLIPITSSDGCWEKFAGTVVYIARHKSLTGPLPLPPHRPKAKKPIWQRVTREIRKALSLLR